MSTNVNESMQPAKTENEQSPGYDNEACVVCFKNVDIYSIGECDHPVCYECSTRMRVLCQQNECPICRHVLSKVIFTYNKLPYRELEAKNRSEFYSKRYKIGFSDQKIQQKFFDLLDHPCPKCNAPPYRTFQGLKNHVRKEHDMHYCELCTENLKIFSFERRCYTQSELGLHRTKGDLDNRSHRGHPLCEYCNKRFLDRDELFRHLRREHYFCHFCDADGCNEFYRDYDALADHFRRDHFLCEEGKCATDQFVGAFRSEIDYRAHVANMHGNTLNKQQAKQTRTLQLEITLGPRGRSGQNEQGIANVRGRGQDEENFEDFEIMNMQLPQQNQRSITIDAKNEQDFPSLGGAPSGPNVSLVRPPPQSIRNRSGIAGLARTKENFPALGDTNNDMGGSQRLQNQNIPSISSVIKKVPSASTGAISRSQASTQPNDGQSVGMVIHVSNRPKQINSHDSIATTKKPNKNDFPALPKSSKTKNQNRTFDMLPPETDVPFENISAKHRTLIDNYVSVADPNNFLKLQTTKNTELESSKNAQKPNAPKLTSHDFPTLSPSSINNAKSALAPLSWVKTGSDKKQREQENRKSKVAPAPFLSEIDKQTTFKKPTANNNVEHLMLASAKKEKKKDKKNNAEIPTANKANQKHKEKNNNNHKLDSNNTNTVPLLVNGNDVYSLQSVRPPPGFTSQVTTVKPPPGFNSNVTVNSVAKSPNNLTFTSSLGDSYNIVPTHSSYTPPPDLNDRNQRLVGHFKDSLKTAEELGEFRRISQAFREGIYKASAYYEHCQNALKEKFDLIFPELLTVLPDISKQQALYLVHKQRLNSMSQNERSALPVLNVCSTCKQVLLEKDIEHHKKLHLLKENFPGLNERTSKMAISQKKENFK